MVVSPVLSEGEGPELQPQNQRQPQGNSVRRHGWHPV